MTLVLRLNVHQEQRVLLSLWTHVPTLTPPGEKKRKTTKKAVQEEEEEAGGDGGWKKANGGGAFPPGPRPRTAKGSYPAQYYDRCLHHPHRARQRSRPLKKREKKGVLGSVCRGKQTAQKESPSKSRSRKRGRESADPLGMHSLPCSSRKKQLPGPYDPIRIRRVPVQKHKSSALRETGSPDRGPQFVSGLFSEWNAFTSGNVHLPHPDRPPDFLTADSTERTPVTQKHIPMHQWQSSL